MQVVMRQFTNEHRDKLRKSHLGKGLAEANVNWKGDKASYAAVHMWIRRRRGIPTVCEHCGKESTRPRVIQWANRDHTYRRELDDWLSLCVSCHKKHDMEHGLIKVAGKANHFYGRSHSEASKQKMRQSLKGRIPWNKGIKIGKRPAASGSA